jgi:hypothetical protein
LQSYVLRSIWCQHWSDTDHFYLEEKHEVSYYGKWWSHPFGYHRRWSTLRKAPLIEMTLEFHRFKQLFCHIPAINEILYKVLKVRVHCSSPLKIIFNPKSYLEESMRYTGNLCNLQIDNNRCVSECIHFCLLFGAI